MGPACGHHHCKGKPDYRPAENKPEAYTSVGENSCLPDIVQPRLEYYDTLWGPHQQLKSQIEGVRDVQSSLNKPYHCISPDSVTNMLRQLEWDSLEMRRNMQSYLYVHDGKQTCGCSSCIPPYSVDYRKQRINPTQLLPLPPTCQCMQVLNTSMNCPSVELATNAPSMKHIQG